MKIEELTTQLNCINHLLNEPEPGLFTWQIALHKEMEKLFQAWFSARQDVDDEAKYESLTVAAVIRIPREPRPNFRAILKEVGALLRTRYNRVSDVTCISGARILKDSYSLVNTTEPLDLNIYKEKV